MTSFFKQHKLVMRRDFSFFHEIVWLIFIHSNVRYIFPNRSRAITCREDILRKDRSQVERTWRLYIFFLINWKGHIVRWSVKQILHATPFVRVWAEIILQLGILTMGFRISWSEAHNPTKGLLHSTCGMIKWHRLQNTGDPFDHQSFPRFAPILWKDFTDFQRYRSLPRRVCFAAPSSLWKKHTQSADNKLAVTLCVPVFLRILWKS